MLDLDRAIAERAVANGLVSQGDIARCETLVSERRAAGKKTYLAQVLVQEKLLEPKHLIELQEEMGGAIYECPKCKKRHATVDLASGKGSFPCKGCGKSIKLRKNDWNLSMVEVLASRDPRDLTISLRLDEETGSGGKSSAISETDLTRYEVEEELGRGGYGVVFKARHKDLDRHVALKILKASAELSTTALERFLREGRAASKLNHPNICQVYDIGRSKDVLALAMELVPGKMLRDVLKDDGPLPWAKACDVMQGILAGCHHAHEHGIIHRDLKPSNVIMEEGTGRPRLIDFGLAKDVKSSADLTGAGQILGTPFYLAPEQVEGRSNQVDARSDVFALGVIFYEILTGERPFNSKARNEVYARILMATPAPPSSLVPGIPDSIDAVVARALAKLPDERFQSAKDFSDAIGAVLEESQTEELGRPTKAPRTKKSSARDTSRKSAVRRLPSEPVAAASRGSTTPVLGLVVALGVVALAAFALSGGPKPPPQEPEPPPVAVAPRPTPIVPAPPPPPVELPAPVAPAPPPAEAQPPPEPPAAKPPETPDTPAKGDDPPPAPAPVVAEPAPPGLVLDDGKDDGREHPSLLEKNEKEWIARAFTTNVFADLTPSTPSSIRALRLALLDRYPLVRAFALRGLTLRGAEDLRAWGNKPLFDNLVENVKAPGEEPYIRATARLVLTTIAGKDLGPKPEPWRAWFTDKGAAELSASFLARGQDPSAPAKVGGPAAAPAEPGTRDHEVQKYLTQAREQGLDVVICLDITPSMDKTLDRVKTQITQITSFFTLLIGDKARLGIVTYGDEVVNTLALTNKLKQFVADIQKIEIFNDPNDKTVEEGPDRALVRCFEAKNPLGWHKSARRVIVIIGDAPMHLPDEKDCFPLVEKMAKQGFVVNTIICEPPAKYASNPKWLPHKEFRELARLGGGVANELANPEELIAKLLILTLGSKHEDDLKRFVHAYRAVTGEH
jgi:serine/threonine-protein kinase